MTHNFRTLAPCLSTGFALAYRRPRRCVLQTCASHVRPTRNISLPHVNVSRVLLRHARRDARDAERAVCQKHCKTTGFRWSRIRDASRARASTQLGTRLVSRILLSLQGDARRGSRGSRERESGELLMSGSLFTADTVEHTVFLPAISCRCATFSRFGAEEKEEERRQSAAARRRGARELTGFRGFTRARFI